MELPSNADPTLSSTFDIETIVFKFQAGTFRLAGTKERNCLGRLFAENISLFKSK